MEMGPPEDRCRTSVLRETVQCTKGTTAVKERKHCVQQVWAQVHGLSDDTAAVALENITRTFRKSILYGLKYRKRAKVVRRLTNKTNSMTVYIS